MLTDGATRPAPGPDFPAHHEAENEPANTLRDAATLNAILPYALGQAKRHHETVSLLCVSVDRLDAIERLHGAVVVSAAVRVVAEPILRRLRASDVIARLEDDRIIALLPDAGAVDAVRVAESIRAAIAAAGKASPTMPLLTASIGVANYPAHAHDTSSLLAAADEALTLARRLGRNRVASPPLAGAGTSLAVVPCAG